LDSIEQHLDWAL